VTDTEPKAAADIVPKAQFAAMCGVHKSRVSHWIDDGKLSGDALVGEGRAQRIRVEVAKAQLRARLDIGQRLGNAIDTHLDAATPAILQPQAPGAANCSPTLPLDPPPRVPDSMEERIKRERYEGYRLDNVKRREDLAAREGRYTLAESARQQMGQIACRMMTTFESSLADFASSIAAHFKIPQRDVLHLLRSDFHGFRAREAASTARAAEVLPTLTEDAAGDGEEAEIAEDTASE
jgi:hypothetical protein